MSILISGCVWERTTTKKLDLGVDPMAGPLANSAAHRDTIGALTYYQGMGPMRVRGYGVVVGLGRNGSSDCPRPVYDRLIQSLYKEHRFASAVVGERSVSPEQLIASEDTAVVLLQADIPPAATKGSRFDVAVMAVPGTQTRSLRGGRLYSADMEMFQPMGTGLSLGGRVLARAYGPVFLNPFADDQAATRSSPLEGIIIGGGEVLEDRRVRLVLTEPSYATAQRIQDRLNAFCSGGFRCADAVSPSFVQLRIPPDYEKDEGHFLALVRSLYLPRDPQFAALRTRALAEELIHPAAPHGQIALCLEGLGRTALPVLNELYTHSRDVVSFHAAVAGLRLGDHLAGDTMIRHAEKPTGEFRQRAIRALAHARGMAATGMSLRRLLSDDDARIRIAAYEALIEREDTAIRTIPVGRDNFLLDLVPSDQSPFVYAKRGGTRRLALFGESLRCEPPVLYRAPDGALMLTADDGADELTAVRQVLASGRLSPPIPAPLDLPDLVRLLGNEADINLEGRVTGLGIPYGDVVRALHSLTQDQSLKAGFVLEEPDIADIFGPTRPRGRPESEL